MKLKEFYRRYGRLVLGISEQDAYELQRVLQGIKGFESGRPGPGGGADATPFTVAMVLIAVMAGRPRRRAKETATDYSEMLQEGAKTVDWGENFKPIVPNDSFTGERDFGSALKSILANPGLARRVVEITVNKDWPEATITFLDEKGEQHSRFVDPIELHHLRGPAWPGALRHYSKLGGAPIFQFANDLAGKAAGVG